MSLRQHGLRPAQHESARLVPVLCLQGEVYGFVMTTGVGEHLCRPLFERLLLFCRHTLREASVEEVPQQVVQVENVAAVFRSRDQQLPPVEPVEQLARFARSD
ncbi:MAG: hypothetical protein E5Y58_17260, partial [Mesorhizobium sp.]